MKNVPSPVSLSLYSTFKHLGLNIVQKEYCIYLDQKLYIEELEEAAVDTKRKISKEAQFTTGQARQLRGLAERLNCISSQTRPDMSFGACEISTSIKDARISDLIHANKNINGYRQNKSDYDFQILGA